MRKTLMTLVVIALLTPMTALAETPVVAVFPFQNSGAPGVDERTVTEMFITELAGAGTVTVVSRGDMETIFQEHDFQLTGSTSLNDLARMGEILNAGYVVAGRIMALGNSHLLNIRLLDVNTAQIVKNPQQSFAAADRLPPLLRSMAAEIAASQALPVPAFLTGSWELAGYDTVVQSSSGYRRERSYEALEEISGSAYRAARLSVAADGSAVLTLDGHRYEGQAELTISVPQSLRLTLVRVSEETTAPGALRLILPCRADAGFPGELRLELRELFQRVYGDAIAGEQSFSGMADYSYMPGLFIRTEGD